jgi:hypothetical protein
VTGLRARRRSRHQAGHQAQAWQAAAPNFQVLVAVQSTILTVTNDALLLTPLIFFFFFKNLLLYTLEGK